MLGRVSGLLALMFISCTVCQEDICSYRPGSSPMDNVTVGTLSSSDWGSQGACHCTVRPMGSDVSYIHLSASLHLLNTDQQDPEDTCQPMFLVSFERSARPAPYLLEDYFVCPSDGMASRHKSVAGMFPGQEMVIHIDNPQNEAIQGMIMLAGAEISIECSATDGIIYEGCPCRAPNWGAAGPPPSGFGAKRRLTIGLVVAFVALLIIVVIIVGVYFYKRKQANNSKSKTYNEGSSTNKAYEGSKHSVNDPKQPPVGDANVNYAPDPTLNLSLQKGGPGHHGSRDSGLASSSDPSNDRRLPFMQPQGASSSLDNLTNMPENYPPLAGHGSKSSLDRPSPKVEPIYTTRAQAQPQYHPGPRAGNPDFQPPLAGHGSQHSLDQPRFYEGDEVVYAKLNKGGPRSASVEHLEIGHQATHASAESLNASRVTIETDV